MGVGKPIKATGYSGTPLGKKLGIQAGFKIMLINPPEAYLQWLDPLPDGVEWLQQQKERADMIHFFTKEESELQVLLPQLRKQITANGSIWVSWPKKASKVSTDVTEDVIRNLALAIGLVDVKVCAVSEAWSGLKLVIPVKLREGIITHQ